MRRWIYGLNIVIHSEVFQVFIVSGAKKIKQQPLNEIFSQAQLIITFSHLNRPVLSKIPRKLSEVKRVSGEEEVCCDVAAFPKIHPNFPFHFRC